MAKKKIEPVDQENKDLKSVEESEETLETAGDGEAHATEGMLNGATPDGTGIGEAAGSGDAHEDVRTDESADNTGLILHPEGESTPLLISDANSELGEPEDGDVLVIEAQNLVSREEGDGEVGPTPEEQGAGTPDGIVTENPSDPAPVPAVEEVTEVPTDLKPPEDPPSVDRLMDTSLFAGGAAMGGDSSQPLKRPAKKASAKKAASAKSEPKKAAKPHVDPVLTIENRAEVETQEDREALVWHEIQNAARTKRILTGTLGGIERMENANILAVVYYKDLRVVIPVSEMMVQLPTDNGQYGTMLERQSKILNNMLGADIDFIIKGIDAKTRSAVASRREAMLRKRKIFYMDTDSAGAYRIYDGRIVQARVIAVASKVVRVEAFGVEASILARDLAWEWIGDAHERYMVGDQILIRVNSVRRESIDTLSIQADVRSVTENTVAENLKKCRVQGKYAGVVTDIHKGVVFIRLAIGVNAIAHTCLDNRMPAKQDAVSFAVTHIDDEQGVAMGLITRIIKQRI